jgi:2-polyprenyl-6-hydroxyphenyl methylase/3-demethylubiquinone-9 3-methyltransferase
MTMPHEMSQQLRTHDQRSDFVEYYAKYSLDPLFQRNVESIYETIIRYRRSRGLSDQGLAVIDVGCNVGAHSMFWHRQGHSVCGVDIDDELLTVARRRAVEGQLELEFRRGTATHLPCANGQFDVCLVPELLEHVKDWGKCLDEFARVLKPGGSVFISTTNKLCPRQQEFSLPLYSWYPGFIKHWCEKRAKTTHRHWVNFATYPAVNWFTYYSLAAELASRGFDCIDRFRLIDDGQLSRPLALVAQALRQIAFLRFVGHVFTSYTIAIGTKCN